MSDEERRPGSGGGCFGETPGLGRVMPSIRLRGGQRDHRSGRGGRFKANGAAGQDRPSFVLLAEDGAGEPIDGGFQR